MVDAICVAAQALLVFLSGVRTSPSGTQTSNTHTHTHTHILYHVSLKFTSATVAAAAGNSMPVMTFCLALLLRYTRNGNPAS